MDFLFTFTGHENRYKDVEHYPDEEQDCTKHDYSSTNGFTIQCAKLFSAFAILRHKLRKLFD